MKHHEAKERAEKIWGKKNVYSVTVGKIVWQWSVKLHDGSFHMIDSNGHTYCHMKCIGMEQENCK